MTVSFYFLKTTGLVKNNRRFLFVSRKNCHVFCLSQRLVAHAVRLCSFERPCVAHILAMIFPSLHFVSSGKLDALSARSNSFVALPRIKSNSFWGLLPFGWLSRRWILDSHCLQFLPIFPSTSFLPKVDFSNCYTRIAEFISMVISNAISSLEVLFFNGVHFHPFSA